MCVFVCFQPSDEDSLGLNVPMSNISEEEKLTKDDSIEHISALTGTTHSQHTSVIYFYT